MIVIASLGRPGRGVEFVAADGGVNAHAVVADEEILAVEQTVHDKSRTGGRRPRRRAATIGGTATGEGVAHRSGTGGYRVGVGKLRGTPGHGEALWGTAAGRREIDRDRGGSGEDSIIGAVGDSDDFVSTRHAEGRGRIGSDGGRRNAGGTVDVICIGIAADPEALDHLLQVGNAIPVRILVPIRGGGIIGIGIHGIETSPGLSKIRNEIHAVVPGPCLIRTGVGPIEETAELDFVRNAVAVRILHVLAIQVEDYPAGNAIFIRGAGSDHCFKEMGAVDKSAGELPGDAVGGHIAPIEGGFKFAASRGIFRQGGLLIPVPIEFHAIGGRPGGNRDDGLEKWLV